MSWRCLSSEFLQGPFGVSDGLFPFVGTVGEPIKDFVRLFSKFERHAPTQDDTKRPL